MVQDESVGASDRREFLQQSGALLAAVSLGAAVPGAAQAAVLHAAAAPADSAPADARDRLVVSTWDFGLPANAVAWQVLLRGGTHPLDACEAGVMLPEADPAVTSVGYGGAPNAAGVVELDSAVMRGDTLGCGAVAALCNILHPVSVARAVMERTPHVLLVGEGALQFARRLGFPEQDMLSPGARAAWEQWQRGRPQQLDPWEQPRGAAGGSALPPPAPAATPADHDTIGMIALDRGRMATAVTTSGLSFKLPGRVGDSPIIGAGSYCDDDVGAAVSTGLGEEVIRAGGCVSIIEAMRRGLPARRACLDVLARVRRTLERAGRPRDTLIAFLVVSRGGEVYGAALRKGFQYAYTDGSGSRLIDGDVLP